MRLRRLRGLVDTASHVWPKVLSDVMAMWTTSSCVCASFLLEPVALSGKCMHTFLCSWLGSSVLQDEDDDDEAEGEAMEAESDEESWVSCSSGSEDAESVAVSEVLFFGKHYCHLLFEGLTS